ncbi:hypothetical protein [Stenotrophomonas sp. ATs4]|uniref:hypothetical protein n=1 Tax=Stenotrophomonas sp. ATs4 TaxID=3402766 RepID=UPI003F726EE8
MRTDTSRGRNGRETDKKMLRSKFFCVAVKDALNRAVEVTEGHDMPDQVRARLLLATVSEEAPLNAEGVGQAVEDLRKTSQSND